MTFKQQLVLELKKVLDELGIQGVSPTVDYPADPKHGDYSSNVALIAAKKLGKNPRELANDIIEHLQRAKSKEQSVEKIEIAGPGFVNFWIKTEALSHALANDSEASPTKYSGKKIMVEFAHPNTHKAFHIGHLRNITTGEAIVRLLQAAGAQVIRANYQGDVGMHIAKALYALLQISNLKSQISNLKNIHEKVEFLGKAYSAGSKAFEEEDEAKKEITAINKKIYAKDSEVWELYQTTRQWSLDYFEQIYKRVGSHFDRYYFESEVYEAGKENVLQGLEKGVFEKSEGAIIFPGKRFGLHDRVFITSEGNPTYEGKDMGLGPLQFKEHQPDRIIHVVGPEQAGYFQVLFEALAQMFPETRGKEFHLAYGWVKLKEGKMSSRTGNVVLGEWLLDEARKKIEESYASSEEVAEQVAVGAVKYSFLKVSISQEIAFDLNESIALEGNSGPYIQYTFARTRSVIARSEATKQSHEERLPRSFQSLAMTIEERDLLLLLARFPEIVSDAADRLAPNLLCTYLFELAQTFNLFYQKRKIINPEEEEGLEGREGLDRVREFRLLLTQGTGETLKKGLALLGISAPEKM